MNLDPLPSDTNITGPARDTIRDNIAAAYRSGYSTRQIAARTGRSYGWVHAILTEAGVTMRGRGYRHTRAPGEPADWQVREWAAANDVECSAHGSVSQAVRDAYAVFNGGA